MIPVLAIAARLIGLLSLMAGRMIPALAAIVAAWSGGLLPVVVRTA